MKKIALAASIAAMGFAITAFIAPKASTGYNFEGVITYSVTVDNPRAGQMNNKQNNTVCYVKGSKRKTVIGGGGKFVNTAIADCNNPDNIILLIDANGSKYSIKPDKTTKLPDPVVKYTDETKTIAGYTCHKAEVTKYKTQTISSVEDVYYTEDISSGTCALQFKGLKGFPLEWTTRKSADNPNAVTTHAIAIEEPTPDGKGRVDVSLERNGKRIACEVCKTTEAEWEVHNIQKCLSAGYDVVVECSDDAKMLERVRKKIQSTLVKEVQAKVLVFEPEAFFLYLDKVVAKDAVTETKIKGYRVNVSYDAVSPDDMHKKRESVAKVVADSLKKLKAKKKKK